MVKKNGNPSDGPFAGDGSEKLIVQAANEFGQRIGVDESATADEIVSVVYDQLKMIASRFARPWDSPAVIEPTALVHEAYLRLSKRTRLRYKDADHFLAVATIEFRQILSGLRRSNGAKKRGGDRTRVPFDDLSVESSWTTALDLAAALEDLRADRPLHAKIATQRFFGGLSVAEVAKIHDLSESRVKVIWKFARSWLHDRLHAEYKHESKVEGKGGENGE